MRDAVFNSAGIPEFYGVSIQEYNEMGVGQKWNTVFGTAAGATTFADNYSVQANSGTAQAVQGTEQVIVGVDLSRESMIRAIATDSESGDEFSLIADDEMFVDIEGYEGRYSVSNYGRVYSQSKIGYYGSLEEGRMIIDDRVLLGLIV